MQKEIRRKRALSWVAKILIDVLVLLVSTFLAVLIVRNGELLDHPKRILLWTVCHFAIATFAFLACNLYRMSYRSFGLVDMMRIFIAFGMIFTLECVAAIAIDHVNIFHPFVYTILLFCGACTVRFAFRFRNLALKHLAASKERERVVIVGAGEAGTSIIRELQSTDKLSFIPIAAVDDDLTKQNLSICGVRVVGVVDDIKAVVEKYKATRILVTMPSVPPKKMSEVLKKCQKAGVPVQKLPGIYQLAAGTVSVSKMRDVEVQDLLGREQIRVDLDEIMSYL